MVAGGTIERAGGAAAENELRKPSSVRPSVASLTHSTSLNSPTPPACWRASPLRTTAPPSKVLVVAASDPAATENVGLARSLAPLLAVAEGTKLASGESRPAMKQTEPSSPRNRATQNKRHAIRGFLIHSFSRMARILKHIHTDAINSSFMHAKLKARVIAN